MNYSINKYGRYDFIFSNNYPDPNLLFQGLGNTIGNTNEIWVDTSKYLTNATQNIVGNQPILTPDSFGVGNYGYVFDNDSKFMTISDNDRFTFSNGVNDIPFSIKFKIKWTNLGTCEILTKMDSVPAEYRLLWYVDTLSIILYSLGTNENYIYLSMPLTPQLNIIYNYEVGYNGLGCTGLYLKINEALQDSSCGFIGTYIRMVNTNSPLCIGKGYVTNWHFKGALTDLEIYKNTISNVNRTLLFEGLGNTVGNNNITLIDTSDYKSNAVAPYVETSPTFLNGWYNFNSTQLDYMDISDSNRFTFSDASGDLPFTIEYKVRFDTVSNAWLPSKRVQFAEWQTFFYEGSFGFSIFAENNINKYIGVSKTFAPIQGVEYSLKFSYDGSGSNMGMNISINNILQTDLTRYVIGVYTKMQNTIDPIRLTGSLGGYLNGGLTDIRIWKGVI